MQNPLVSIIIPTYNRAHLIGETLDSVLAQTYTNWECIVVDDGSTDETDELLASYCKKDTRFQYHHRPAEWLKGANACRNYGFELSKGEYVNWFDSDDLFSKNKLLLQMKLLMNDTDKNICVCQSESFPGVPSLFNNQIAPLKKKDVVYQYIKANFRFSTNAPIFKKDFLLKINIKYNVNLKRGQEYEFFGKLIPYLKIIKTNEVLVKFRVHHTSIYGSHNILSEDFHIEFLEPRISLFQFYLKNDVLSSKSKYFFYYSFNSILKKIKSQNITDKVNTLIIENYSLNEVILYSIRMKYYKIKKTILALNNRA